ncbi:MAG: sulfite exporter TauE/SafE family protein [Endomicrobium sp.]|jgi:uncharacterized membrane protein YfcA|uniref:TSUP family transporter n=1 Tax=Candidatus Endomicrobiellum cubanum TaxID=3242325 RepID=UPI00282C5AB7|nr:sulfite exporter TauE/SafE family protein [Endomicrobium sp.]MDR2395186.1 sulfite exporter TauE/SafE family protein [Endomicrobium sp.]
MEIVICIVTGFLGGFFGGIFGVGGASVLIPLMLILLKMSQHQAQGTSLAVIALSFFSMLVYYKKGHVNLTVAALIGLGFVIGGFFGASIADMLPENILKKCFAVVLLFTAVKVFISK